MMLKTSAFSEVLQAGVSKGQQIADLSRRLVELMSETHGRDYRAEIDQDIGYVLIRQK